MQWSPQTAAPCARWPRHGLRRPPAAPLGSGKRGDRDRHREGAAPDQHAAWSVDIRAGRDGVVLAAPVGPQPAQPGPAVRPRGAPTWDQMKLVVGARLDVEILKTDDELTVGQPDEERPAGGPVIDARQRP